jgi:hypothetical protein
MSKNTKPSRDGEVTEYLAPTIQPKTFPRIYYVNGIRVMPDQHMKDGIFLSSIAERTIFGIYNMTGKEQVRKIIRVGDNNLAIEVGSLADLLQCGTDWLTAFGSQVGETATGLVNKSLTSVRNTLSEAIDFFNKNPIVKLPTIKREKPVDVAQKIRSTMSEEKRTNLARKLIGLTNPAAASLFSQLHANIKTKQLIIAHSQGNLCTSDALWALAIAHGDAALANINVYSLASPTPAWPAGIDHRRKVYGHTNDLVTLCDPHNWTVITKKLFGGHFGRSQGDWRQHGNSKMPGLAAHDFTLNVEALNFYNRLRRDCGLPELKRFSSPPK